MYIRTHAMCMHSVCVYEQCMYACVHVGSCVYILTYVCIHTYICTCLQYVCVVGVFN